jgi:hypothetical protein
MAEATITDLILTIREENEKGRDETKKNTSQIITLNKTFSDYFTMLKRQALDVEESRRDADKGMSTGGTVAAKTPKSDSSGGGFLGMVAAILAAGGALVFGFVEGFVNATKDIIKLIRIIFKPITKPIVAAVRLLMGAYTKGIKALISITRLGMFKAFGLGVDGKPVVATSKFMKGLLKTPSVIGQALNGLGRAFSFLGREASKPFKMLFFATQATGKLISNVLFGLRFLFSKLTAPLRGIFTSTNQFIKDIKELGTRFGAVFKTARDGTKSAGVIGQFFSGIGQTFKTIVSAVKPLLGVFRLIGRVVFFPLTIIMGIFDGIKGAMAGAQEEGILGGILGAVGGIFGGLIGMPLDLLKSAVAWIAGKMGFENVEETLKSFSFKDMFLNLFIGIAGMINTFVDNITSSFQDGIGSGLSMVLTYLKRMLLFPAAVAAGGVAALAAALPGGKSPSEAFSDAFNATFKLGEGSVLPSPSSNTSGSEISSQVNDNASTRNGFLAGQSSTQVIDTSQQNNVNITQTQDVAATDDTDKRPN